MLSMLLTTALLVPAADTDPVPSPKGTPPAIVIGHIDKDGKFSYEFPQQVFVTVAKEVKVNVNGKEEVRMVTVTEPQTRMVKVALDLSKATITDASGKKIDKKALARRLAKPSAVVFSTTGKAVDKGFLAVLKADTPVIIPPVEKVAAPGTTAPVVPKKD